MGKKCANPPVVEEVPMPLVEQEEASSLLQAAAVVDTLLNDLRQEAAITIESEVRRYLQAYPDLSEIVFKAVTAVRKHIADAYLMLNLYSDPEIHDQYLALVVRVPVYDEHFMARLEEAEAEYIEQLGNSAGWLQLTTDFQPPETISAL